MTYQGQASKPVPKFRWVSCNQHGARYESSGTEHYNTGRMSAAHDDADGMRRLILIAQMLRIPVEYDFDKNVSYVDIAATQPRGVN